MQGHPDLKVQPTGTSGGTYFYFEKVNLVLGLAVLALVLSVTGLFAARRHYAALDRQDTPKTPNPAVTGTAQAVADASPVAAKTTGTPSTTSAKASTAAARAAATEPTVAVQAGEGVKVVTRAMTKAAGGIALDFEIHNTASGAVAQGYTYGVATYRSPDGRSIEIESHPGAIAAAQRGSTADAVGLTYKARVMSQKRLSFAPPTGQDAGGSFDSVRIFVTNDGKSTPAVTTISLGGFDASGKKL